MSEATEDVEPIALPVEPVEPSPPPVPRRSPWEWIVDYNPFYLLSAVSMLLGLLMLSNTTTWDPVPLARLWVLLGTLQVYEVACLLIGVFLYRKLGPRRDAIQLLALVLVFAVDVSFLMSEIATDRPLVGGITSAVLLVAAFAKAALVLRGTGIRLDPRHLLTGGVGLVCLYLTPPLLALVDDGRGGVEVIHFYALWWIVGLAPLVHDLATRTADNPSPLAPLASRWLTFVAVLPWVSLAIHVGVLHYVYDRPFMAPLAAPLLIGLALLLRGDWRQTDKLLLRNVAIGIAAMVSLGDPARLSITLPLPGLTIGSLDIGLAAAWLALAYVNVPRLVPLFAGLAAAGFAAVWFGPSADQVGRFIRELLELGRRTTGALLPKTRFAWGCVAVAGAFLFLGIGAVFSLKTPRDPAVKAHAPAS